jgi:hypothetical protein
VSETNRGTSTDNIHLDHPIDFPQLQRYFPINIGILGRMARAKVIQFYVPATFLKKVKWVVPQLRGQMIQLPRDVKKSA